MKKSISILPYGFLLLFVLNISMGLTAQNLNKDLEINTNLYKYLDKGTLANIDLKDVIIKPVTGLYSPDNGYTVYYVRQIENKIYWYSENRNMEQSHVFSGELSNGSTNAYTGKWYDLPNGNSKGKGRATFIVNTEEGTIRKTQGNAHHELLRKITREQAQIYYPPSNVIQNQWKVESESSMTGFWKANDGSNTYVLQDGEDVVWFSEVTHPHETNPHQNFWSNVFIGKVIERIPHTSSVRPLMSVVGTFVDVPKGTYLGDGNLTVDFRKVDAFKMVKYESPNYGTKEWHRQRFGAIEMLIGQIVAISDDACDEMDWKVNMQVGIIGDITSKNFEFETDRGLPGWDKVSNKVLLDFTQERIKIGTITFKDEDDTFCGGGHDVIDVSPLNNQNKLTIYTDYFGKLYFFSKISDISTRESFANVNDILTRITGDGSPKAPDDNLEIGEITLTVKDGWVR